MSRNVTKSHDRVTTHPGRHAKARPKCHDVSQKVTAVSRHTHPPGRENVTTCHKQSRPCDDTFKGNRPSREKMSRNVMKSHGRVPTHPVARETCHDMSQKITTVSRPAHGGARRCAQSRPFRGQTACPPPAAHFIRMTRPHFGAHTGWAFVIGGQRVAFLEFVSTFSVETQRAH